MDLENILITLSVDRNFKEVPVSHTSGQINSLVRKKYFQILLAQHT